MIDRVCNIDELEKKISNEKLFFWGNNWIGTLLKEYIFNRWGKEIVIHNDMNLQTENIFLIGQEKEMEKLASDICSKQDRKVIILTNELKDMLDSEMMEKCPSIYESEILLRRKAEMDSIKYAEFKSKIEYLFTMREFPIFESVEIETINRCNGTCSFCPVNKYDDIRVLHKMDERLFYSIIDQLSDIGYRGRVALCSNNEPFIDKRICEFAEYTEKKLPDACKVIFTNGTLVKEEIFNKIIKYIDVFNFDIYYDKSVKEEIPDEVRNIIIHNLNNEAIKQKVMIQTINRSAIRNNRGGQSKNRSKLYKVHSSCMLPFIQMIIRPNGETSLCCNDALGKKSLADLKKEPLVEAWNNENYKAIRSKMKDTRQNIEMCKLCDNFASSNTMGNDFFSKEQKLEAWEKIQKLISE